MRILSTLLLLIFLWPVAGLAEEPVPASYPPDMIAALEAINTAYTNDSALLADLGSELTISHHDMRVTLAPETLHLAASTTETIHTKLETKQLHLLLFGDFVVDEITVSQAGQPVTSSWSTAPLSSDALVKKFLDDFGGQELPPPLDSEMLRMTRQNLQVLTIQLNRFTGSSETFEISTSYAGSYEYMNMDPFAGEAVYLDGSEIWFPDVFGPLSTFDLELRLPADWDGFAQGKLKKNEIAGEQRILRYESRVKQGQIVAIAGPYQVQRETRGTLEYSSFFFPETAAKLGDTPWIDKAAEYITFFSNVIGDYPFESFAAIETTASVGQGYPSFTLLGGQVLNAHFLEAHSLGHEILHCWLGNAVIWSGTGGNWTEGLTTYLANMYYEEVRQGPAAARDQRKRTLEDISYTLRWQQEIPSINEFVMNEDPRYAPGVAQTVGYHKVAMLIHGWRTWLGDEAFFAMLRSFVSDYTGKTASLDDLTGTFYDALVAQGKTTLDKETFVRRYNKDWYDSVGMPHLLLDHVFLQRNPENGTYSGEAELRLDKYTADFLPPLRMAIYDGIWEAPDLTYSTQHIPFVAGVAKTDFDVARPPNWIEFDPDYEQLRWIPDSEKTACFKFLRWTGNSAYVMTDITRLAMESANINLAAMFTGHASPILGLPNQATAERLAGNNIVAIGTLADLPWMRDILEPPYGVESGEIRTVANPPTWLDLGGADAVVYLRKHPSDPLTVQGVILGKDDAALAAILKKLPFYPMESYLVLRGGQIEAHDRLPVEIRSLRYSLRDYPQPEE